MNNTQDLHNRPRRLTGGTLYVRRPRPIRVGDRVKCEAFWPDNHEFGDDTYPRSRCYGTVKHIDSTGLYTVLFDDNYEDDLTHDSLRLV